MSGQAAPITLTTFREALKSLTIQSLHMKFDELRNSVVHLNDSNQQLKLYSQGMLPENGGGDGGNDQECIDAIQENEVVIARFQDRINLLAAEIKDRGLGFQTTATASTTTSSSPREENYEILSVLTNKGSFDTRINGLLKDEQLEIGIPSIINEKDHINPNHQYDVEVTDFKTIHLNKNDSQLENETFCEALAENVRGDEGVYL